MSAQMRFHLGKTISKFQRKSEHKSTLLWPRLFKQGAIAFSGSNISIRKRGDEVFLAQIEYVIVIKSHANVTSPLFCHIAVCESAPAAKEERRTLEIQSRKRHR